MHLKPVNYVFFGLRTLQGLQNCLHEPASSIQILANRLPENAEQELRSQFGDKLRVAYSIDELQKLPRMRGFLLSDLKSLEDLYFEWSGRQDFPFVVTVKESHRPAIVEKNQLHDFEPNIDHLLRELVV